MKGPDDPGRERGRARRLRDGVRAVAPLLPPSVAFGVSFGILARSAGMGLLAPLAMSATTFAGSAQFVAVSILAAGGALPAAVAAAALLNARYVPLGISVAPSFSGPFWLRLLQAQMLVDESWAVSATGDGGHDRTLLVGAGLALYACWVGGTLAGLLGAGVLEDPNRLGLDAAFPALFLALLLPRLRSRQALLAAAVAVAVALALVPLVPAGVPILVAGVACLVGLVPPRTAPA